MLYTAVRKDNFERIYGQIWRGSSSTYMIPYNLGIGYDEKSHKLTATAYEIIPETLGQRTEVRDVRAQDIYVTDLVESNFSGTNRVYEVVFKDGSFGISYVHNEKKMFAPFTSFAEPAKFRKVGNKYDTLPRDILRKYFSCAGKTGVMELLGFIRDQYVFELEGKPSSYKYVDALNKAILCIENYVEDEVVE